MTDSRMAYDPDRLPWLTEERKPRRRVTSDSLIKLSQRYAERGDVRAATNAMRLAEVAAAGGTNSLVEESASTQAGTVQGHRAVG